MRSSAAMVTGPANDHMQQTRQRQQDESNDEFKKLFGKTLEEIINESKQALSLVKLLPDHHSRKHAMTSYIVSTLLGNG